MNCRKFKSHISAYLDNKLPSGQKDELGQHTKNCASCREEFYQMDNLKKGLSNLDVLQTSSDFNARLWARIRREETMPVSELDFTFRQKLKWALATCLVTIAMLSAIVLTDPRFNLLRKDKNDMAQNKSAAYKYQLTAKPNQVNFVIDKYKPSHGKSEVDKPSQTKTSNYIIERRAYPQITNSGERFILPVVSTQSLTKEESY